MSVTTTASDNSTLRRLAPYAALVALVVVALADPLLDGRLFFFRDLGRYVHPVLAGAMHPAAGELVSLPRWTHSLGIGRPLLSNPGYALLHPATLVYRLLPFDVAFDVFIAGHVAVAALGMAWLARRLGASRAAAFAAGAAFGLGGAITSAANLYPTLVAMAWAPWTLAAAFDACRRPTALRLALLAAFLSLQALGGQPEPVVLTVLAGGAWSLAVVEGGAWTRVGSVARAWGLGGTWALLFSAPQILPTLLLTSRSLRGVGFTAAGYLLNSVDPRQIQALVVPHHGGSPFERFIGEFWGSSFASFATPYFVSLYAGMTVVALAALGIASRRAPQRSLRLVMAATALCGIVGALGSHLPGAWALMDAHPGLMPFRYPVKLMFLTYLALPPLAAFGLDAVTASRRVIGVLLATIVALDLELAHAGYQPTIERSAVADAPPLLAELRAGARVMGLADTDWRYYVHDVDSNQWLAPLPRDDRSEQAMYRWQHRLLVPPMGAEFGLRYAFEPTGDALETPESLARTWDVVNRDPEGLAKGLGRASVLYMVAPSGDLEASSAGLLHLEKQLGPAEDMPAGIGAWLYRVTTCIPRATMRTPSGSGSARISEETDRSVAVETVAAESGSLVLRDALPEAGGWSATLDDNGVPIEATDLPWCTVAVPAGRHVVRLTYRTPGFRAGAALAGLGAALAAAAAARRWRGRS